MPSQSINGTDSSRRQSGRSTCCDLAESTPSCQPTLTWKVTMTTIASPSSPWDGAPWCLKTQNDEPRGLIMALKVSPLDPSQNIIVAPHAGSHRLAPSESPTPL
ncbi:hypothetical protein ACHAWF_002576 [Thalassiosira exigua]